MCVSFFSESFDLVILCSQIVTYCKQTKRRDVSIHREGSKIRHININGVRLGEIKRLLAPGSSLASLGAACNLKVEKSIFPFSKFTSLSFLDEVRLPADCADWVSDLSPDKVVTQAAVDQALALFEEKQMPNISAYLEYYLDLDCVVLMQSIVHMHDMYYQILGLSFVDSKRYTVSSFASCAAQTWLCRKKHGASFFPNHQRVYSLLRNSLRGGLSCVARTACGRLADVDSYVELLKRQLEEGGEEGGPDQELRERIAASGLSLREYVTHCNAHLGLPKGKTREAVSAVYADINR